MLVVFDLDWKRFDINDQVAAANNEMNSRAREKGLGCVISFNLASLGAGERIMALRNHEKPDQDIIDELRQHHWRVARTLGEDGNFKAYRDVAEMLSDIRSRDYRLAAVFAGAADVVVDALTRARVIDYFEESVYSRNSVPGGDGNLSIICRHAMDMEEATPSHTIIISDNPQTIGDVRFLRPKATVGYLDPHRENGEISTRLKELEGAKANYTTVGGYSIPWYCDFVRGKGFSKSL